MQSVPFSIPNAYGGFTEAEGLTRLEEDVLTSEFEAKDSTVGKISGVARSLCCWIPQTQPLGDIVISRQPRVKEVSISVSELDSVTFRKKLVGSEIVVTARSMNTVNEMPGSRMGAFKMRFNRKDSEAASKLASNLNVKIAELELERLDNELEKLNI